MVLLSNITPPKEIRNTLVVCIRDQCSCSTCNVRPRSSACTLPLFGALWAAEDPAAFVVVQSTAQVGIPRILSKLRQGLEGDDSGGKDHSTTSGSLSSLRRRIVHQLESLP